MQKLPCQAKASSLRLRASGDQHGKWPGAPVKNEQSRGPGRLEALKSRKSLLNYRGVLKVMIYGIFNEGLLEALGFYGPCPFLGLS